MWKRHRYVAGDRHILTRNFYWLQLYRPPKSDEDHQLEGGKCTDGGQQQFLMNNCSDNYNWFLTPCGSGWGHVMTYHMDPWVYVRILRGSCGGTFSHRPPSICPYSLWFLNTANYRDVYFVVFCRGMSTCRKSTYERSYLSFGQSDWSIKLSSAKMTMDIWPWICSKGSPYINLSIGFPGQRSIWANTLVPLAHKIKGTLWG